MAVLADPAGAVFMLWQPKESIGAELVNEDGAWSWSELVTDDVEGSKRFYGEVFGWQTTTMEFGRRRVHDLAPGRAPSPSRRRRSEGGNEIRRDDARTSSNRRRATPTFWIAYFAVADVDATVATRRASSAASVIAPAFDAPGVGRIAVLSDPQGASFAVITPESAD